MFLLAGKIDFQWESSYFDGRLIKTYLVQSFGLVTLIAVKNSTATSCYNQPLSCIITGLPDFTYI